MGARIDRDQPRDPVATSACSGSVAAARARSRPALCRSGAAELGNEEIAREVCDLIGLFVEGEVAAVE